VSDLRAAARELELARRELQVLTATKHRGGPDHQERLRQAQDRYRKALRALQRV
jgi:hypothetical protein